MAREAARLAEREIGLLGDLPGPKLRLGELPEGGVDLHRGSEVTLTVDGQPQEPGRLPVSWSGLPGAVSEGGDVYLADGRIRLRVLDRSETEVRCMVEAGGRVSSHQGLNLPGANVALPAAGQTDLAWVDFAVEQGIDLLAVSFVRRAEDLVPVEAAPARRRRRHPADREDREAAGGRERRVDHRGGARRDHGGPRRPRHRAADRQGARWSRGACSRSPASTRSRRSPRPRCSPRWSPRRARRGPRSPTWPTRSGRGPTP